MGWEDTKADVKKAAREADEKAKETWRKADGEESVSDHVANLGDDIRNELGNAGDDIRRHTDDMDEDRPVRSTPQRDAPPATPAGRRSVSETRRAAGNISPSSSM
jgi:hypothetical protein